MRLITTSVPPSVLCQSLDKVNESRDNVKVKRKCGRPRNPIPRHKRVSHISAEHRRRGKIQDAFQSLKDLVPPQTQISGRLSKADVLFRAVDKCQELDSEIRDLKTNLQSLTKEKEALSLDVKVYKVLIHEGHNADKQLTLTLDDLYYSYVEERSKNNPCFKIFTLMMNPVFESFKMAIKDQCNGQFLAAIWDWAFKHLTMANLRAAFVNTNDITSGSDSALKDQEPEMKVRRSTGNFHSHTSTQALPSSTASMPIPPPCTAPFHNSMNVINTNSCVQSIQNSGTLSMTSENEHPRKNFIGDHKLHSVSRPGDQSVAVASTLTTSQCFAVDGPRDFINSKYSYRGPHKFKIRRTLNRALESGDTLYESLFNDSQLMNACTSVYQNQTEEPDTTQLPKNNSDILLSTPSPCAHSGTINNVPTPFNNLVTVSKGTAGVQVNQVGESRSHTGLPDESNESMLEKITCAHSSHQPCRQSKNLADQYSTDISRPSYDLQAYKPNSLTVSSGDEIPSDSMFSSPKINQSKCFMRDKCHDLKESYPNSYRNPNIVQSDDQDHFRSLHTVHHLPHQTACLCSPRSRHDQNNHHYSSNTFERDNPTFHQELSRDSRFDYRAFSLLGQLLGTPNSANQSVDASGEENKANAYASDATTTCVHFTDTCHNSPPSGLKFHQPVSYPTSQNSLLSSLDFVPQLNRSCRRNATFTAQRTPRLGTWSPSEAIQCLSPDAPPTTSLELAYDHVTPSIHDNMWSVTRSDQAISPCLDDAVQSQKEFTSPPKMAHTIETIFGEVQSQSRDSWNGCHRTFKMDSGLRQRNGSVSPRTSPLTYINMDAY